MSASASTKANSCGITIEEVDSPILRDLEKKTRLISGRYVKMQPFNTLLVSTYANHHQRIQDMEVRDDDVWICTFPKCGTTWTQEMAWCIINDLDFKTAKETMLMDRTPFIDINALLDPKVVPKGTMIDWIDYANSMTSPRLLKTHLPYAMIPKGIRDKKVKIIYVSRNPRDAFLSNYNHTKVIGGYTGSVEDFCDAFVNDVCGNYMPFIPHVRGFWEARHAHGQDNILFLTYEEMKRDLGAMLRRVAEFVGKGPLTDEQVDRLKEHLAFENMRENDKVNRSELIQMSNKILKKDDDPKAFMLKGRSGGWKERFTPEMLAKFEEWEKKGLEGSDFKFDYGPDQ